MLHDNTITSSKVIKFNFVSWFNWTETWQNDVYLFLTLTLGLSLFQYLPSRSLTWSSDRKVHGGWGGVCWGDTWRRYTLAVLLRERSMRFVPAICSLRALSAMTANTANSLFCRLRRWMQRLCAVVVVKQRRQSAITIQARIWKKIRTSKTLAQGAVMIISPSNKEWNGGEDGTKTGPWNLHVVLQMTDEACCINRVKSGFQFN